jgi:hypothetical protein
MTARTYVEYCSLFEQFGKIKDINFDDELFLTQFSDQMYIRFIDFKNGFVTIGELIQFGCECCGDYFHEETYDLDGLAKHGYLEELIDMMNQVLKIKIGI